MNHLTRRKFLSSSATLTSASLLGLSMGVASNSAFAAQNRLNNIGLELYTVRGMMEESVADTLAAVAEIGYQEVEFAGYFGHSAAEIKTMVADAGLTTPSTHIQLEEIRDNLDETMDMAAEIGHDYVVLAYLVPAARTSFDQYKSYIDIFSRAGEAAKSRGMQFGYHNHDFEFLEFDGVKPYDYMLEQVDPELMKMTLDLYWIHKAGNDALAYIDKYPGRFGQCHVKDSDENGRIVDVGTGVIDFASIFAQNEKAGFQHFHVEHDLSSDPLATAENSLKYLQNLTF